MSGIGSLSQNPQARQIEATNTRKKAGRAQRPLRWIAVANTIGAFGIAAVLQRPLAAGNVHAEFFLTLCIALAVAYWGIWAWSLFSPLPASIVGLLLFITGSFATCAQAPTGSEAQYNASLGPIDLITIILLIKAIFDGVRHRVLTMPKILEDSATAPKSRSILSAILLYFFCLSIVVIPRSLAADHKLEIKDFFDVNKMLAIVVIAWAAIAWRDTLPALRLPSFRWMFLGILMGLGTFAFASIYLDSLSYLADLRTPKMSAPLRDAGYSWLFVLGMIAVYPAIFEELAFRGIIVPCLNRLLTTTETIIVSGMMFMILHLSIASAPQLLLLGTLIAWLRIRSGSIWPCMLMHFTHNAMCIAFEKWM